jgi:uncharacterized protein YkwD
MKKLKLFAMSALALALAACGGGGDGDSGSDPNDVALSQAPAAVQTYANLINTERAKSQNCGGTTMPAVSPLTKWNPNMQQAAQKHADDMAKTGVFSHTGSDGSLMGARNAAYNYTGNAVGENIAQGYSSPQAVVSAWVASPGHCQTLMDQFATTIALASNGKYVVLTLGY